LFKIGNFRILPSFGKHNKKWATAWKLRQVWKTSLLQPT